MAKKLNEDEIKWILSVESSKAQQEIRKLTKVNRELNKTNKERRELMRNLEAQGKKESDEYQRLDEEIKKSNKTISTNNKLIGELEKKLDVTGLTMVQLRKKAKDLRQQLDNTVKSTHPEEYAELEAELSKVNSRMEELRGTGKYAQQQLTAFDKTMNMAKTAAKGFIAVQLVRYLKDVGMKSYETRKEYARFEATLRNATGSSEEAAKAMKMLQQLAKDTPASVSEWTESYIKLVNRGIKPTTDELTAMGDIAMSQGKDIDQFIEALLDAMTGENERLKEFGITASKNGKTTAYTFRGVTTEVQNTDMAIKNYILSLGKLQGVQGSMATQMNELAGLESNIGDQMESIYNKIGKKLEPAIKSFMGTLGRFMGTISKSLDSSGEKFDDQLNKVVSLQNGLLPLLNRYDELKAKTNLSAQEQDELNQLISRIAQIIPGAVTGFDNYGRAISVSTDYAREWIKTEKARLAYINKSQIEERKNEKKNIEERIKSLKRQESIGKRLYGVDEEGNAKHIAVYSGGMGYGPNAEQINSRKMTADEQNRFKEEMKSLYEELSGVDAELSRLQGTTLDDMIKTQTEMIEKRKSFNEMNKESLFAWIDDEKNATSEYLSMAQEIYKNRFPVTPIDPDAAEEEAKRNEKILKEALQKQTELFEQQKIELKQRYLAHNDEQLQTESQFNKAMEDLTLQDLNARLKIMGLEVSQRQQIEQQILDIRIKALEDFRQRKLAIETEEEQQRVSLNKKSMDENKEWLDKQLADRQQHHNDQVKIISDSLKQQVDQYKEYGSQMGESLGKVLSGQEDMLSAFGNTMIDILFDVLSQIINQKIAEATAVAIAEQAKAAAISAAQPDSVATFGATAAARTAIISGLIMAALTAAKTTLKGLLAKKGSSTTSGNTSPNTSYTRVPGRQSGGYIDVTRAQDGKEFQAVYDPKRRGFIDKPTVIVGEGPAGSSKEWVASNEAVKNPTIAPILSILDQAQQAGTIRTLDFNKYLQARTVGKQDGGQVSPIENTPSMVYADPVFIQSVNKLNDILSRIDKNGGIHAYTILSEFEKKQELRNRSRKIGSK
nr:MAG: hypothetical protein [Bacteriophage sp.]UWG00188.1 MAG: hypothetical protein [Bacteriophage sp.]UWH98640.1 MAG: hypothetical protein [Bacteriophage sp.]